MIISRLHISVDISQLFLSHLFTYCATLYPLWESFVQVVGMPLLIPLKFAYLSSLNPAPLLIRLFIDDVAQKRDNLISGLSSWTRVHSSVLWHLNCGKGWFLVLATWAFSLFDVMLITGIVVSSGYLTFMRNYFKKYNNCVQVPWYIMKFS